MEAACRRRFQKSLPLILSRPRSLLQHLARRPLRRQPGGHGRRHGADGGWRDDYPAQKSGGNIRQCCVFLLNKCPSTRQSQLEWEWSVSPFPLLRGWGFISKAMMNSQQTPTPYGPWVSMHLNEPSLPLPHATRAFLNSLSCQALHQTQ